MRTTKNMRTTIHRILHVNLPFSETSVVSANRAVSQIRGVDIGDGKKYRFIELQNFKTVLMKDGCKLKHKNEKGRTVWRKRKDSHFHQSFDIILEEVKYPQVEGIGQLDDKIVT